MSGFFGKTCTPVPVQNSLTCLDFAGSSCAESILGVNIKVGDKLRFRIIIYREWFKIMVKFDFCSVI